MSQHNKPFLRLTHKDQSGQALFMVAAMMIGLLAFAAFVVDFGRVYISFHELETSTNAAALAGAELMPIPGATQSTVEAQATLYSGVSGNKNAYANLPNVAISSLELKCLTTLTNEGIGCVPSPGLDANAIQVVQTVTVPLIIAKVVGTKSVTLTAEATAAMAGVAVVPYNVVMVVDSTNSMHDSDGGSNCSGSREECALEGVQVLLQNLAPCSASLSSCGSATNNPSGGGAEVTNPVDQVSLLTFPAVTDATTPDDYSCPGSTPTIEPYPLFTTASNYTTYSNLPSGTPATTYQIVNFSSDYRSSDTSSSLNTSSDIVRAVNGKSGCGMSDNPPGGEGTYYAGIIYSAESFLLAQQAKNLSTQNALILLSDGEAQAACTTQSGGYCTKGQLEGNSTDPVSTTSGLYPSTVQQCHQAITAAQWAAKQNAPGATTTGTRVYAVAYGAESSGCTTDTSPTITPCQTMQAIASKPQYFYTDYTSSSDSCVSASQPVANLNQIFTSIAESFTVARLIPNNTT